MNTYEKCCAIRHAIMTRVAENQIYERWSDEFRLSNIRDFFTETITRWSEKEDFTIDVSDLTEDEMKNLYFGKWSKENTGYLIPIWLYPFLQESVKSTCIDGNNYIRKSEMDTDHRMGYLAYSVIPKTATNSVQQLLSGSDDKSSSPKCSHNICVVKNEMPYCVKCGYEPTRYE